MLEFLVEVGFIPAFDGVGLVLNEVGAHREFGFGEVEGVFKGVFRFFGFGGGDGGGVWLGHDFVCRSGRMFVFGWPF